MSVLKQFRNFNRRIFQEKGLGTRISILAPSDSDDNLFRRLQWGDYWVKYELTKALGEMGYIVTEKNSDVIIHLFGSPVKLPRKAFKVIWIYSHPERISPQLLKKYNKIYCLSFAFNKRIRKMGFDSEFLSGATAKKYLKTSEYKYDVIFIGNNRMKSIRQIVRDVGDTPYNFKIWGKGWERKIDIKYIGGQYIDYPRIDEYYAQSKISLNDHSPQMRKEGFVAIRIYDILASGGFCISDRNHGIEEIFGNIVPQYDSAVHLRELIDYYIKNEKERKKLREKGRKIVSRHTWYGIAKKFVSCLPARFKKRDFK